MRALEAKFLAKELSFGNGIHVAELEKEKVDPSRMKNNCCYSYSSTLVIRAYHR